MNTPMAVDLNPLRAGLVGRAEEYPWSSAWVHIDGVDPSGTLDFGTWGEICPLGDWSEALAEALHATDQIRAATRAGNPYGNESFVAKLEGQAGKTLRLKPPGPRPRARSAPA